LRILIAIPVYNEAKYVGHVIDKIKSIHPDVLVVDDGSTDGTGEYLAGREDLMVIRHAENRGYGQSIIDAFKFADERRYDWVITIDCDEQHEPERIPAFIREIRRDKYDVISGSRYLSASGGTDVPPADRQQINRTITEKLNELFGWKLTDAFCGYKAHRVEAMRKLKLDEAGYAFPLQFWPQVHAAGLRVKELPVKLIYNDPTRHFGGMLDDAQRRLAHYLEVLQAELTRIGAQHAAAVEMAPAGCSATCCCGK
jgi:glycosyltransferase involved in cell wall biosynthesis